MTVLLTNSNKKFYPVIHCIDPYEKQGISHALINTRTAMENGADGIFLIGHGLRFDDLTHIYDRVREQFPTIWIGINFLDLSREGNLVQLSNIVHTCTGIDALWTDHLPNKRLNLPSKVKVFGGVAFKYIDPNQSGDALTRSCNKAVRHVDIATTSGVGTGYAPGLDKLGSIKEKLAGRIPLALASGVDSSNVSAFLEYVDIFLVASSISETRIETDLKKIDYLVPEKVRELADLIHG